MLQELQKVVIVSEVKVNKMMKVKEVRVYLIVMVEMKIYLIVM